MLLTREGSMKVESGNKLGININYIHEVFIRREINYIGSALGSH